MLCVVYVIYTSRVYDIYDDRVFTSYKLLLRRSSVLIFVQQNA